MGEFLEFTREHNQLLQKQIWDANWRQIEHDARERAKALQRARSSARRAAERQRTPAWADREAIKAVYLKAKRMETETGLPHHVDHVLPLCGALVSGLHVAENLQILTASENMSKHNRFEVEP